MPVCSGGRQCHKCGRTTLFNETLSRGVSVPYVPHLVVQIGSAQPRGRLGNERERGGIGGTFRDSSGMMGCGEVLVISSVCAAKSAMRTMTRELGRTNTRRICILATYVNENF